MGFKVVLLGAVESTVSRLIKSKTHDYPWDLSFCGADFTAESEASVESYFQAKKPSVVISLMAAPGDQVPVSALKNVSAVCARQNLPIILQSSYWAIQPADERAEILETFPFETHAGSIEYARHESMAAAVDQHVILRSSWILDSEEAGLFSSFLPVLVNPERSSELVVSDHDYGAPVSCEFIADAIIAVVQQILTGAQNWGAYHLRSADACSEAEFCDHLLRQLQKEVDVELPSLSVASQDDERRFFSMNANLIGRRLTDDFGIQAPTWRKGYGRTLRAWLEPRAQDLGLSLIEH